METTVTTKGQLTLPVEVRHALGIDAGTVLEVELGAAGSIVLRKKPAPGFFDQFVGLKAKGAPFASGDAAREALRVAEDEQASYSSKPPARKSRKRR
jgi:AbrB family looped-hinge helix DNA binding protein